MDPSTDWLYGVPIDVLCALTGAHLTTARRWKRTRRAPRWLRLLIQLCIEGELGAIARHWDGWSIRGKHLVSPEGWEFTPGEVRSIPFMHSQVAAYQARQRCIAQADWIDERWTDPHELSDQVA
jgi:Phage protein